MLVYTSNTAAQLEASSSSERLRHGQSNDVEPSRHFKLLHGPVFVLFAESCVKSGSDKEVKACGMRRDLVCPHNALH